MSRRAWASSKAANAGDADLPDEADARLGEIETALQAYDNRPAVYRSEDLAIAGAFVSIDGSGKLGIERGYVRPEDELPIAALLDDAMGSGEETATTKIGGGEQNGVEGSCAGIGTGTAEPEEDEGLNPLPDRLLTEPTASRTVALREAIGRSPQVAFTAALHALCLKLFYHYAQDSCVEIDIKNVSFGSGVPGLNDSVAATTIDARHRDYAERLPRDPGDLWDALVAFGDDDRASLFAHCIR